MWCKNCNIETNENLCPVCGAETAEDIPVEVYWCKECSIPLIHLSSAVDKGVCPICGKETKYLSSDLRPVFPEERLLLSFLLNRKTDALMNSAVWAANSRYYINGKSISISTKEFAEADTDEIARRIAASHDAIDYSFFDDNIARFIQANQHRLHYLKDEAFAFVQKAVEHYKEENIVISFSGGKDSTATADVVTKALSNFLNCQEV